METLRIISTGLAVPSLVTNQDVVDMLPDLGITKKWLDENVGIRQRHISIDGMQPPAPNPVDGTIPRRPVFKNRENLRAAPGCCNSDLCAKAIADAVSNCPVEGFITLQDIDMIIVTTVTPDVPVPATSTYVMEKLGLNAVKVMDIRSACCGFTTGLQAAAAQLVSRLGGVKTVAVVGCEVGSVFGNLNPAHPTFSRGDAVNTAMIGDAAAAVIVRRFDNIRSKDKNNNNSSDDDDEDSQAAEEEQEPFGHELLHVEVKCIGNGKEEGMFIPCGGSVRPFSLDVFNEGGHFFHHDFKKVLQHGAELYYAAIQNGLQALSRSKRFAALRNSNINSNESAAAAETTTTTTAQKNGNGGKNGNGNGNGGNGHVIEQETNLKETEKSASKNKLAYSAASIADIDLYIPHQANGRITSYAVKMGIDPKNCHEHFADYGNTANASLPLGIHLESKKDQLPDGALVMCLAAESTKWLHGTIVLVWHSLNKDKLKTAASSSSATTATTTRLAAASGFSGWMRRFKKSSWFVLVGWLLWLLSFVGTVLAWIPFIGGGNKKEKKAHRNNVVNKNKKQE